VKLLLDQNLSPRLVGSVADLFPRSAHVRDLGFSSADDQTIWDYAREQGFTIVSKDSDFHQLSFLLGPPPKVIWVRRGNCSTSDIEGILRDRSEEILAFAEDTDAAFLALS
jgi:predicted nuclease of predicted toxin-antitoxin system